MLQHVRAKLDWMGGLLALLYGLPTLGYVFGRDQALFCYVGREWAAGRLPYVEAFDVKPPGIYAVYALAGRLFGFQMWAIRTLELCAVLALGALIALAVRREQPRARGELGATMLLTSAAYFTIFDYWDTGQAELWEGLLALAGYLVVERLPLWRASLLAGALGGAAILFKPTVAVVLVITGCVLLVRAYREGAEGARLRSLLLTGSLHAAAAAIVIALMLGYFASRGGWPALLELADYTAKYVQTTSPEAEARQTLQWFWSEVAGTWAKLALLLCALGVGLAYRRRAWRVLLGQALAVSLTLAAMFSVAVQKKFWAYHWVVVLPFALLAASYAFAELARVRRDAPLALALAVALLGCVWTPHWGSTADVSYRSYTKSFWAYVRGTMRRSEFLTQFVGPFGYDYAVQEQVGDRIGELAKPGDQLHVRGFEPAVYIHARLASPSRFASDAPISLTANPKWIAEQDEVLWSKKPRFFVSYVMNGWDLDALKAHGYQPIGMLGRFIWFEQSQLAGK